MNLHSVPTPSPRYRTAPKPPTKQPNPTDLFVGKRIRARRKELGMSQTDLGKQLGISFQQVQKYEKGTNRVGGSRIVGIAKALEAPVDYFFPPDATNIPLPAEPHPTKKAMRSFIERMRGELDKLEKDLG